MSRTAVDCERVCRDVPDSELTTLICGNSDADRETYAGDSVCTTRAESYNFLVFSEIMCKLTFLFTILLSFCHQCCGRPTNSLRCVIARCFDMTTRHRASKAAARSHASRRPLPPYDSWFRAGMSASHLLPASPTQTQPPTLGSCLRLVLMGISSPKQLTQSMVPLVLSTGHRDMDPRLTVQNLLLSCPPLSLHRLYRQFNLR